MLFEADLQVDYASRLDGSDSAVTVGQQSGRTFQTRSRYRTPTTIPTPIPVPMAFISMSAPLN